MGGKGSGRKAPPSKFDGTNYSRAWKVYKETPEYTRAVEMLELRGMKQPFVDNWIQAIFGAGFVASGVKIELILKSNS